MDGKWVVTLKVPVVKRWGVLWRQVNGLNGTYSQVMWDRGIPLLFHTRQEARAWARTNYGYVAKRPDLRRYPHGWRMPQAVRVGVTVAPLTP